MGPLVSLLLTLLYRVGNDESEDALTMAHLCEAGCHEALAECMYDIAVTIMVYA